MIQSIDYTSFSVLMAKLHGCPNKNSNYHNIFLELQNNLYTFLNLIHLYIQSSYLTFILQKVAKCWDLQSANREIQVSSHGVPLESTSRDHNIGIPSLDIDEFYAGKFEDCECLHKGNIKMTGTDRALLTLFFQTLKKKRVKVENRVRRGVIYY